MFVIILLYVTQCAYHSVAAFFYFHFDALDYSYEITCLESLVYFIYQVLNVILRCGEHRRIHADALKYIRVCIVDTFYKLVDSVFFHKVVKLFGKAEVLPVFGKLGRKLKRVVFAEV